MKKVWILGAAVLVVLSCSRLAFASARVTAVSGIVRAFAAGSDIPQEVSVGQILPEGTEVRTTGNGRVTLEFESGNTVRIRSNGRIVLSEPRPQETRIKLLAGKMKGVFSRLLGGRKFAVEYPSGTVCAVKGTETVNEVGNEGAELVNVLFGAAAVMSGGKVNLVPQGCGAVFGESVNLVINILNETQIVDGLANWDADQLPSEQGEGAVASAAGKRDKARDAIKEVLDDMHTQIAQAQEQTTLIREEDFAAGRTMRDIHGNLTRVDQRIQRPNPTTVQFVNIVKRDSYNYTGGTFHYACSTGPRLDYLMAEMKFNIGLPATLEEWPEFFRANIDGGVDIEPVSAAIEIANGTKRAVNEGRADYFRQEIIFSHVDGVDDEEILTINGNRVLIGDHDAEDVMSAFNGFSPEDGDVPCFACEAWEADGEATDDLWGRHVDAVYLDENGDGQLNYTDTNVNGKYDYGEPFTENQWGYMNTEFFIINNDGNLLNAGSFTDNVSDPFGILKTTAAEGIVAVTTLPGGTGVNRFGTAGGPGNIDIVITPDIILTAVEKIVAAASQIDFGDGDDGSGELGPM